MSTISDLSSLIPKVYLRASDIPSGTLPTMVDIVWLDIEDEFNTTFPEANKGVYDFPVVSGTETYALPADYKMSLAMKNNPDGARRYRLAEQQTLDRRAIWIDEVNSLINVPEDLVSEQDLRFYYVKKVADCPSTGDLPMPLSSKLLKILAYGCAFYWLAQKTGEDDHLAKLTALYQSSRAEVFIGGISRGYGNGNDTEHLYY